MLYFILRRACLREQNDGGTHLTALHQARWPRQWRSASRKALIRSFSLLPIAHDARSRAHATSSRHASQTRTHTRRCARRCSCRTATREDAHSQAAAAQAQSTAERDLKDVRSARVCAAVRAAAVCTVTRRQALKTCARVDRCIRCLATRRRHCRSRTSATPHCQSCTIKQLISGDRMI